MFPSENYENACSIRKSKLASATISTCERKCMRFIFESFYVYVACFIYSNLFTKNVFCLCAVVCNVIIAINFINYSAHIYTQAMVTHGRVELLAHPLSQKYLQMKWNSYGKYFHVTNLLIYTVFLMFVTIYASQLMGCVNRSPPNNRTLSNETKETNSSSSSHRNNATTNTHNNSVDTMGNGHIDASSMMLVSSIAIIVYVVLNSMREVLQIYQQKWKYLFEPNNLVSWLLYISAILMVSPVFNDGSISDVHFSATSLAVFLSWFNLLLFLQRFDQVSLIRLKDGMTLASNFLFNLNFFN